MDTKKKFNLIFILLGVVIILSLIGAFFIFSNTKTKTEGAEKPYQEIVTKNQGSYIVKNMVYTAASLDFTKLEKVMKEIRSGCKKPCKINLYADRKTYDLDVMAGLSDFDGYTAEQRNYLETHLLAFWGIDEGDNIEFYPNK